MRLKTLLKNIDYDKVYRFKDVEITGICSHSKWVCPGNLFIAKRGKTFDGTKLIPDAVLSGALAVVTDLYDPYQKDLIQIIHPNPKQIEEKLASTFYNWPQKELFLIGVTGTNGKTTCSYLIKHLLDKLYGSTGLMGTIGTFIGDRFHPATLTTADLVTNTKMLSSMRDRKVKACVMEVTSHALDQGRTGEWQFDIALFTNLSHDHLDYHKTMDNYLNAKAKLFSKKSKKAVVFGDFEKVNQLLKDFSGSVFTYGFNEGNDLRASSDTLSEKGSIFTLEYNGLKKRMRTSLIGRFNILNLMAAVSVALVMGLEFDSIISSLESFQSVPGRLEPVPNTRGLHIFVDYAHTDDALRNTLLALKEIKKGKLITLFGCGGNRDRFKREKMAKVVEELSDMAIVTSDNPREEDPMSIIEEITKGFSKRSSWEVCPDRKKAIYHAINLATENDIILIAGKGHENVQIIGDDKIPFDDRLIAKEALC